MARTKGTAAARVIVPNHRWLRKSGKHHIPKGGEGFTIIKPGEEYIAPRGTFDGDARWQDLGPTEAVENEEPEAFQLRKEQTKGGFNIVQVVDDTETIINDKPLSEEEADAIVGCQ